MSDIEIYRYAGRGVLTSDDGEGESQGWPEVAYEAIRAINHLTGHGAAIPAPTVYRVLGDLKGVGHLLPQALTQLGSGLERSLTTLPVYDLSGDPRDSVTLARQCLAAAAAAAGDLGRHLERAQESIAVQGFHDPGEGPAL